MSSPQASEFRYLVRLKGKDLDGRKKAVAALADLKGVGYNFAQAVVSGAGIDPKMRFGQLSESQVKDIERVLADTSSLNVPQWAFNRKRDPESGETKQLIGSDLDLALKERRREGEEHPELEGRQARPGAQGKGAAHPHHGQEGEDRRREEGDAAAGRRRPSRPKRRSRVVS